ncbi:hypothetical protein FPV67DRAFT_1486660 [Lyophyllum atratum]|nr:hypothetical protein FPV67DRAFT_1486660 [Lyophyllum atratum]
MPLPETTLSLGPHTNPGESEHSKPKVAMLVRMSTETLDALQALGEKPPMDFEFGDTPGIHIGGTFYPMRSLKEETPHELYLRTHSASKPNAPLKLYANVTGKFTIEHDKLGANLKDRIREKTIDAAKQRDDRKTKFIDTPPTLPAKTTKKRKEQSSAMFRNAIRPSDQVKLNASNSSKKPSDSSIRKRLVHCMAVQERPRDQIIKLVTGADCDASKRREVLDLLEEVAEQTSATKKGEDPGSKIWRLRTESWKEVRPFEWPKLPEQERINLARTGRQKLSSLGIKQSDPLWEHFTFRSPATTASATPSAGPSRITSAVPNGETKQGVKLEVVAKRGVSSKEVKEKKAKPKPDPGAEIQMKDESIKAAPRVSNANGKMKDTESASSKSSAVAGSRKPPGSGFRAGKTTSQDSYDDGASRSSVLQGKSVDRGDANQPRSSLPAKVLPSTQQATKHERLNGSTIPTQRIRKLRESDAGFGSDSDRERGPDRLREGAKTKTVVKQEGGEERRRLETPTLKRKQDGNDSEVPASQKKRRTETGAVSASSSKDTKPKDLVITQKARTSAASSPKSTEGRKEIPASRSSVSMRDGKASPQKVPLPHSPAVGQTLRRTGASHKNRRKSPIYTSSSEDEGEIRKPRRDAPNGPPPTLPMTSHHPSTQSPSQSRPNARESRPLPTDHASLRVRYSATYNEYVAVFGKMVSQKTKIDGLLRNGESGSTTDSDGDADLMDAEDLARLSVDYKRLYGELATIRGMFPETD